MILRMIQRRSLAMQVVGIVIGVSASLWMTKIFEGLIYGVKPTDPIGFLVAAIFVFAISGVAMHLPARRAAASNPMTVLRQE